MYEVGNPGMRHRFDGTLRNTGLLFPMKSRSHWFQIGPVTPGDILEQKLLCSGSGKEMMMKWGSGTLDKILVRAWGPPRSCTRRNPIRREQQLRHQHVRIDRISSAPHPSSIGTPNVLVIMLYRHLRKVGAPPRRRRSTARHA